MKIYKTDDFSIRAKADNSPLTIADKVAHQKIVSLLMETNLPVLSEEGADVSFEKRVQWEYFWMVDPLDGTKEFIKKNGEFTVNIALIHKDRPILGVVYAPVLRKLYWALEGNGAFLQKDEEIVRLATTKKEIGESRLRILASRSHVNKETKRYLSGFKEPIIISMGSSLKFLLVASGEADIYPRFGPTMEWDTAAAHVIVNEAGGSVTLDDHATPLAYNKKKLVNPGFIVLPV